VSTRLGSEGIPVTHGRNIRLADDPEDFAAAVIELLRNRKEAARMAAAGRRFVEEHFAWDVIGARFEETLHAAAAREVVT